LYSNDLYRLEIDFNQGNIKVTKTTALTAKPDPLSEATINIINHKQDNHIVVLYGGTNDKLTSDNIWVFYPEENKWENIEIYNMNMLPRKGHTSVLVDKLIYNKGDNDDSLHLKKGFTLVIFGGKSIDQYISDVLLIQISYMIQENKLYFKTFPIENKNIKGDILNNREGHQAIYKDDNMYIIGGCDYKKKKCYNKSIDRFNIKESQFIYNTFNLNEDINSISIIYGQIIATRACNNCEKFRIILDGIKDDNDCKKINIVNDESNTHIQYKIKCDKDYEVSINNETIKLNETLRLEAPQNITIVDNPLTPKLENIKIEETKEINTSNSLNTTNSISSSDIPSKHYNITKIKKKKKIQPHSETLSLPQNFTEEIKKMINEAVKTNINLLQTNQNFKFKELEKEKNSESLSILSNITDLKSLLLNQTNSNNNEMKNTVYQIIENIEKTQNNTLKELFELEKFKYSQEKINNQLNKTINCINGLINKK
jgi:hypothetical protein